MTFTVLNYWFHFSLRHWVTSWFSGADDLFCVKPHLKGCRAASSKNRFSCVADETERGTTSHNADSSVWCLNSLRWENNTHSHSTFTASNEPLRDPILCLKSHWLVFNCGMLISVMDSQTAVMRISSQAGIWLQGHSVDNVFAGMGRECFAFTLINIIVSYHYSYITHT